MGCNGNAPARPPAQPSAGSGQSTGDGDDEAPSNRSTAQSASRPEPQAKSPSGSQFAGKRYLIVHADDAGMCRSVNRATIEAMEQGIVTSASIMVPCPAFEEFAAYAKKHPERDFGIHLTLNAEYPGKYQWRPVLSRKEVPGLVDRQGYLWATEAQTAAHARADEVERELVAQIERARARGVTVSHLDTHMGAVFTRPDFLEVYVNLGIRYDLPVLFVRNRRFIELFPTPPPAAVRSSLGDILARLDEHRLPVVDNLHMHYVSEGLAQKRNYYWNLFRTLPEGVNELIVHCGYADRELSAITGSVYLRDGDRSVMTDPRSKRTLEEQGITLISWKQLVEMTRKEAAEAKQSDSAAPSK